MIGSRVILTLPREIADGFPLPAGGAPADTPWAVLETITLDPVPELPPAGPPWNGYDRCTTCGAFARQPCRDRRAKDGRPARHPHRGRPAYVSPGYAAFLLSRFGGGGS